MTRFALLMAVAIAACSTSPIEGPVQQPSNRTSFSVLFIGNSLTYENSLPQSLADLVHDGGDTLIAASAAYANYALIDHYNGTSNAKTLISLRHWDYVVMQQGPTSDPGLGRDTLIIAAKLFEPLIRNAGATPALYMVWTDRTRVAFMDGVKDSYFMAAQAVNGAFFPAGKAWQAAWAKDASLALYGSDDFHPSRTGTYLAALVMYEQVTHRDARLLPARANVGGNLALSEATFRLLQQAAHDTNASYGFVTTH